jgi:hypothetical protein
MRGQAEGSRAQLRGFMINEIEKMKENPGFQ